MRPLGWTSRAWVLMIILGITGASCATQVGGQGKELDAGTKAKVQVAYGKLPLSFEANQGQTDEQVKFLSRGNGYTLFLTSTETVLTLRKPARHDAETRGRGDTETFAASPTRPVAVSQSPPTPDLQPNKSSLAPVSVLPMSPPPLRGRTKEGGIKGLDPEPTEQIVLRMKLLGANSHPQVVGLDELPGKVNYFIGNDPTKWHADLPTYAKVRYRDVYPGVDLVYYGNQRQLEYDFVVAPGADPKAIKLSFEGTDKLEIDSQGDLILYTEGGEVRLHKPRIYQEINGAKQPISGGYVLLSPQSSSLVTFHVAAYDASRPLVIDPVLSYSTYLGGSSDDYGIGIAVDTSGSAYVTGHAFSTDFPTMNPLQPVSGGLYDAFVAKLNPTGSALLYSTYLGGNDKEFGFHIAVDASGNAYVTGDTKSTDFPTMNPLQPTHGGGGYDTFVAKLSPTGSALVYSTYLGGSAWDFGDSIAVDASGNAYVMGYTFSIDFPTVNPLQPSFGGSSDVFVAKLNPTGSALVYSTYLGGRDFEYSFSIAIDASGNAYVTGRSHSTDFPTVNPLQPVLGGDADAFVAKLNPAGSALVYSTYLGGRDFEYGRGIAIDASGNAYVTGRSHSTDFPTVNPLQPVLGGDADAFVAKLNSTGSALIYSTYLGGNVYDEGNDIAVDASGNAYVTGWTWSADFPTVNPLQSAFGGGSYDAFVAKLNSTGSALVYSTYLGGNGDDSGNDIAVDASDNTYVTGATHSTDFPMMNPLQAAFGGVFDAFVAKIAEEASTWIRFPLEGEWVPIVQGVGEWYQKYCGYHLAHDVARSPDTPVYPMADGMVKYARVVEGLGCAVHIEHQLPPDDPLGGKVVSVYYHLKRPRENSRVEEICLREGSAISKDQPLGYVSGKKADYGDGPHLHFGIRKGAYQGGCDPRTKKWYYPGYTTIYKGTCGKPGQKECKSSNPVHQQILAEWISDPEDFIRSRGGQ